MDEGERNRRLATTAEVNAGRSAALRRRWADPAERERITAKSAEAVRARAERNSLVKALLASPTPEIEPPKNLITLPRWRRRGEVPIDVVDVSRLPQPTDDD